MKKKDRPLVSIIMNCHNGGKYLEQSLNSIFLQTYKKWELIFWDNKSTDNSKKILKKFKSKKIKYFYSKTLNSLYKSRNLAVQKARGKYITFLDVDDLWQKNRLKKSIDFLKKNKLRICYSNYLLWYQKKKIKIKAINYKFKVNPQFLLNKYNLGILTVTVEKSFFKKNFFDFKYQVIGDFDFFIKLSLKTQIGFIKDPLATYRVHGNNYSIKNIDIHIDELDFWIKKNEKKMQRNNFNLKEQKKYLLKLKFKKFLNYYKYFKKI